MDYYIAFEGRIDQQATFKLFTALKNAENKGATRITILFSSLGGSIYEGFLLASVIQNSKIPIAIHATNHIDSIANVIYLSAKERTSESYTKFYLHGATSQGSFDEKKLRDELTAIKTNNIRIAYFISENSAIPLKRVQAMMRVGTTISAQEALKYGVVQQIKHLEIPLSEPREEIIFIN
ncbi:MAG TPA: ATP-dependent Clp protease proteolytic subunit [Candidatus Nanoarchaeia archaeon]|nr:ATP-dependent Clp protease proteolytic subunit [Candidatus Nanoarchaeia archaeon]